MDELNELVVKEYEAAMTLLIQQPAFRLVLVQLYASTRPGRPRVFNELDLGLVNFDAGQHIWVHSVVSWMESQHPEVYFTFLQELYAHDYRYRDNRRRDLDRRDDDE